MHHGETVARNSSSLIRGIPIHFRQGVRIRIIRDAVERDSVPRGVGRLIERSIRYPFASLELFATCVLQLGGIHTYSLVGRGKEERKST